MLGFLETVVVIMGVVGVLAGTAVLARSLMLYLLEPRVHYLPEPRVHYLPEPSVNDREGDLALATLNSLKELLVGLLPSRWPR